MTRLVALYNFILCDVNVVWFVVWPSKSGGSKPGMPLPVVYRRMRDG
jgi:hypothetical protein